MVRRSIRWETVWQMPYAHPEEAMDDIREPFVRRRGCVASIVGSVPSHSGKVTIRAAVETTSCMSFRDVSETIQADSLFHPVSQCSVFCAIACCASSAASRTTPTTRITSLREQAKTFPTGNDMNDAHP